MNTEFSPQESEPEASPGLSRQWRALLLALQFLTAIPVKGPAVMDKPATGLSLLYYPLVGLLMGLLLWGCAAVGLWLFSPLLCAALVVTAWVLLTGALHIDGLADCADAWVGGFGSRERTLTLMKDPTSGPVAVAIVVLLLLVKTAAVYDLLLAIHSESVLQSQPLMLGLLLAPLLGRLLLLPLLLTTPYVRKAGLGEILIQHFPRRAASVLCAGVGLALLLIDMRLGVCLLLASALLLWWLRRLMIKRLAGCTGDTLGATTELAEVTVLLTVAACS